MTIYQLNNETVSSILGDDLGMYCINNVFYPMPFAQFFDANKATTYGVWVDGTEHPTHLIAFFPETKSWMGITFRDGNWWNVVGGELENTIDHPFSMTSLLGNEYEHEIVGITVAALQIKDTPDAFPVWEM